MKNTFIITIIVAFFLVSCEKFFDPEKRSYIHYQVINSSHRIIEYSFFTYNHGEMACLRIGESPISPSDTLHGGLDFFKGRNNYWTDYFEISKIDTFYVVISTVPIEAKEGQKYDALPNGANVLKTYKYTKENFYGMNPTTDIVTFEYP